VLARVDGEPVLIRQGNRFAATFHPELTDDARVHALLLGGMRTPGAARASPLVSAADEEPPDDLSD